jgi:hypothetical protein
MDLEVPVCPCYLLEVRVVRVIQMVQMDHQLLALLSIRVFQASPLAHRSLDHPSALQVQEVLRNHHGLDSQGHQVILSLLSFQVFQEVLDLLSYPVHLFVRKVQFLPCPLYLLYHQLVQ